MASSEEKYFNAPIQLYQGFLINSSKVLSSVSNYACYAYHVEQECTFQESASFFNIKFGDMKVAEANGKRLYLSIDKNAPKVGIGLGTYWQFHGEVKTEFEKVCLLAFLAIKSILQRKPYCKIDNRYFLSRMDGMPTASEICGLSYEIKKYANEYQTKKIKNELRDNWGLITYSRYTRGFYVSFNLPLESLILEAEKKRKSFIDKMNKDVEKDAVKKVLEQLSKNTTITRPSHDL